MVRLDNDYGRPVTILRACGVNPDALKGDPDCRADVIRAYTRAGGSPTLRSCAAASG